MNDDRSQDVGQIGKASVRAVRLRRSSVALVGLLAAAAAVIVRPAVSSPTPETAPSPDSQPTTTTAIPATPYAPTSAYEVRQINGWRIFVSRRLLEDHPKTCDATLELLQFQLYQINRRLPAAAVEKLRKISIWVEFHEGHHPCMVYHPDVHWLVDHGMNPDKARCVEIADARNFLSWTREQPWMVLHEMAHGYHDQFTADGFENADVLNAYRHAMETKRYESVLHIFGRHEKAYATTNPQEYFAELTEAYFGTNDFFPFVRAELKQHDPEGFEMMHREWED